MVGGKREDFRTDDLIRRSEHNQLFYTMVNKARSGLVSAIICCDCFATQQVKPQVGQRVEIARIGRTQRVKIGELGGLIRGGRIDGRERKPKRNTAYFVEILSISPRLYVRRRT